VPDHLPAKSAAKDAADRSSARIRGFIQATTENEAQMFPLRTGDRPPQRARRRRRILNEVRHHHRRREHNHEGDQSCPCSAQAIPSLARTIATSSRIPQHHDPIPACHRTRLTGTPHPPCPPQSATCETARSISAQNWRLNWRNLPECIALQLTELTQSRARN
jgi:hypothetical protein